MDEEQDDARTLPVTHLCPMFGQEHLLEIECWCHPGYALHCGGLIVVHNVLHLRGREPGGARCAPFLENLPRFEGQGVRGSVRRVERRGRARTREFTRGSRIFSNGHADFAP